MYGGGRAIEAKQTIMALAVLADAVGEIAQAPIFGLADAAAEFLHRLGDVFHQCIDLLRRNIGPRDEHVFVKGHVVLFLGPAAL